MFRISRTIAGVCLAAGFALIMAAFGPMPVRADQGDIWTQAGGSPANTVGHEQDVHLPCGSVDIWADQLASTSGTWTLYHQSPPNTSQDVITSGAYTYTADGIQKIATIPQSAFASATGPHFKVVVDNDNNKSKTFWLECAVTVDTTPNPASATVGDTLKDTATVGGGFTPTGTLTFTLFNPTGSPVYTETVPVSGDGGYATAGGFTADVVGSWHWSAAFTSSDTDANKSVTSADEPVTVNQASPTITTTPSPAAPVVGDTLKDTATLSGGFEPGGTITFALYSGTTVLDTESVTVAGDGSYTTPSGFVSNAAGDLHWSAAYSGDANNKAVTSADEPLTVAIAPHALTTTPKPASATVGATLKDEATLSGDDNPTGTITFTLRGPDGKVFGTPETVTVSGNGTYTTSTGFVATAAGTWHWQAAYSGDGNNSPAESGPEDEPVTVNQAQPSISTTPAPETPGLGDTLKDTAVISGGYNPTGSLVFTLYDSTNQTLHSETVTVSGNGSYTTATGFVATAAGTLHWKADYSGDTNNAQAVSLDEPVTVSGGEWEPAQPKISTTPNPTEAPVGATIQDSATLSGGSSPTGTITFTLYDPNSAAAYTETIKVSGNGAYSTVQGHVAGVVGKWSWKAAYSGDEGNYPVTSDTADEVVTVDPAQPSITTTPNPTSAAGAATLKDSATLSGGYNPAGTITFTLYDPNNSAIYSEAVAVNGNGQYSTVQGHAVNAAGTYHWKAAYGGDGNNLPVSSNLSDEAVTVTATGGVLAATGSTPLAQVIALALIAIGGLAILSGLAWRTRQAG